MKHSRQYILLQGGLGNQMFQYAFYLAIKHNNSYVYCDNYLVTKNNDHNGYELKRVFSIDTKKSFKTYLTAKILNRLHNKKKDRVIKILSHFGINLITDTIPSIFIPEIITPQKKKHYYYLGYWQTEKYFKHIESQVKSVFIFNTDILSVKSKQMAQEIKNCLSVSIHIRRGDYLQAKYFKLYGNICTLEYYQKAISIVSQKYNNCHFFIFSDDIEWTKTNFSSIPATFIDFNKGQDSWQDMYLMSLCQHNIIANSSFSWWAAWLNSNQNKTVICPSKFLNTNQESDIIPENWIQII